jgi:hypothetical protein
MRSVLAVAEYVRVRVGGVVESTGEKGDGGTARREDRNGTAVVLIFAGIFQSREEGRLQRYVCFV